jgi:hypothetical protein
MFQVVRRGDERCVGYRRRAGAAEVMLEYVSGPSLDVSDVTVANSDRKVFRGSLVVVTLGYGQR